MRVKDLVKLLLSKPQNHQVVYCLHSEYCLLEAKDIEIKPLCHPREDGWVADARPDKPLQNYLVLPGN